MRLLPLALLVFSALAGCSQPQPAEGPRAFYFWRTHLALSATEREALASLQVTRLFVHVFDVVRAPDGTVQPVGMLTWADAHGVPADVEVVPTIFIREAVFRGASEGDPQALARKTWAAVSRIARGLDKQVQELQLDCDWSDGSREGYFAFLRALHDVAGPQVRLSATIRLHQVKYRERTGVPPVERGMLMAYNMGTFDGDPAHRSIFDAEATAPYLARLSEYPLPLDVALPIWSWVLQVRQGHVVNLLQDVDPAELSSQSFLRPGADGQFTVESSSFFHGTLLRETDTLKPETVRVELTREASRLIVPKLAPHQRRTTALFELSDHSLQRHPVLTLRNLFLFGA